MMIDFKGVTGFCTTFFAMRCKVVICKPLTSLKYSFHRTMLATLSPACKTAFCKFSPAFSASGSGGGRAA
jgi:hypothetical protein